MIDDESRSATETFREVFAYFVVSLVFLNSKTNLHLNSSISIAEDPMDQTCCSGCVSVSYLKIIHSGTGLSRSRYNDHFQASLDRTIGAYRSSSVLHSPCVYAWTSRTTSTENLISTASYCLRLSRSCRSVSSFLYQIPAHINGVTAQWLGEFKLQMVIELVARIN